MIGLRIPASVKLTRAVQRTRRYFTGRALILLYHRVANAESDPWQLAVTPEHLEEHLQFLTRHYSVIPLKELSKNLEDRRLKRRSVVVTFDDGYADNLLNAKPLLEKYDVPATVFVATGYIEQDREFWWDELDRVLIQPGKLPSVLTLEVNGRQRDWDLGGGCNYDETCFKRNRQWRASQVDEPTPRHSVYRSLWQLMYSMSETERLRVRGDLLAWAGATTSARKTHRALTCEQIIELERGGLIEVGSHTITHPQLSSLSAELQREEIKLSKHRLEEIVGHPVAGFAYPYGRECDYTRETLSLVRESSFDYACTTTAAAVKQGEDRFQLPRIPVQDIDGESFARCVSESFDR